MKACISLPDIEYRIGAAVDKHWVKKQKGVNGGWQDRKGYWIVTRDSREQKAHRVMWEHHHGPIPPGMEILHLCHNPSCVNIDHLKLGTHAENMAMEQGKRQGENNGGAKLTDAQAQEIRERYHAGGVRQIDLGQEYGVTMANIQAILCGRSFRHVGGPRVSKGKVYS